MVYHRNAPIKSDDRFCRCKFTWDGPDYKDRHTCVNGVDVCIVCKKVSPYFGRVCAVHYGAYIVTSRDAPYGNCTEDNPCRKPPSIEELLDGL